MYEKGYAHTLLQSRVAREIKIPITYDYINYSNRIEKEMMNGAHQACFPTQSTPSVVGFDTETEWHEKQIEKIEDLLAEKKEINAQIQRNEVRNAVTQHITSLTYALTSRERLTASDRKEFKALLNSLADSI